MTNKEYQEQIEKRYGKPLKEIMYELIVDRHMDQWDGSTELGVPKDTFITWRTRFRLGPDQRRVDLAERMRNDTLREYKNEMLDIDIDRPFSFREENSLRGFKEIIERMIELEKQRKILIEMDSTNDIFNMLRIATLEEIISYLNQYNQSQLHKTFKFDLDKIKQIIKDKS
jgi:hypothetical protein